jgi:hypothetical protein
MNRCFGVLHLPGEESADSKRAPQHRETTSARRSSGPFVAERLSRSSISSTTIINQIIVVVAGRLGNP